MATGTPPPDGSSPGAPPAPGPGFPDEELLALLRDASVTPEAIAEEMADAGAAPLPVETLREARAALQGDAAGAPAVEKLSPGLRARFVESATAGRHVALLVALAQSADKTTAKQAKRAIHLLRSRGVAVEVPRPAPAPAPAPARPAEESTAFATAPDGFGDRILFFPLPGRLGQMAQIVVSDEQGVHAAQLVSLGKRGFRRFLEGAESSGRVLIGEVPRDWARARVAEALDQNARAGRPVPEDWNEVAMALGAPVPPQTAPGRALVPQDAAGAVAQSAALLDLPELSTWMPGEETLRSLALRLDEIAVSTLYIDEQQREASGRTAVVEAIRGWWTPERRKLVAERLYELAWLLQGSHRPEQAKLAAATGSALESEQPLDAVPFAFALFERMVALMRPERPPRPGAPTPPDEPPRSPGGLILP